MHFAAMSYARPVVAGAQPTRRSRGGNHSDLSPGAPLTNTSFALNHRGVHVANNTVRVGSAACHVMRASRYGCHPTLAFFDATPRHGTPIPLREQRYVTRCHEPPSRVARSFSAVTFDF